MSFFENFGARPPQQLAFFITDVNNEEGDYKSSSKYSSTMIKSQSLQSDDQLLRNTSQSYSSHKQGVKRESDESYEETKTQSTDEQCAEDGTSRSSKSSDSIKMESSEETKAKFMDESCDSESTSRFSESSVSIKMESSEESLETCVSNNSLRLSPSLDISTTQVTGETSQLSTLDNSSSLNKNLLKETAKDISHDDIHHTSLSSNESAFMEADSLDDNYANVSHTSSLKIKHEPLDDDVSEADIQSSFDVGDIDDKPILFECDSCDKTFNSESNFARHLITHTEDLPFDCEKPDPIFENRIDAEIKQLPATQKTSLTGSCVSEERECDREETLSRFTFQCDLCDVPFYSESEFAKHLIKHCEDSANDDPKAIPTEDSDAVQNQFHFESVDGGEVDLTKPFVLKTFGDETVQFEVHKTSEGERLYEVQNTTKGRKLVLCDQPLLIEYKEMFFEIIRTGGERRFLCKICDRSYTQKSSLNQHLRSHTGVKPHKCRTCEKTFARHSHLFQHERTHTGEKPFTCNICNATFTQKASVLHHQRVHTGEKPHKCHLCDKAFSQKSNLHYHIKIHSGEKPFKCELCQKTFNRKSNLTVHIKAHLREKQLLPDPL